MQVKNVKTVAFLSAFPLLVVAAFIVIQQYGGHDSPPAPTERETEPAGHDHPASAPHSTDGGSEHHAEEAAEHGSHGHKMDEARAPSALPAYANTTCPVMPEEKVDPSLYVEHAGKKIFVCCKKCQRRVAGDPEAWYQKVYGDSD